MDLQTACEILRQQPTPLLQQLRNSLSAVQQLPTIPQIAENLWDELVHTWWNALHNDATPELIVAVALVARDFDLSAYLEMDLDDQTRVSLEGFQQELENFTTWRLEEKWQEIQE